LSQSGSRGGSKPVGPKNSWLWMILAQEKGKGIHSAASWPINGIGFGPTKVFVLFPIVDYLKDWLKMLRTTQERRRRTTCDSLQMPITSQTRKLVSAGPREVHLKEIPPEIKGNLLIKQTNN